MAYPTISSAMAQRVDASRDDGVARRGKARAGAWQMDGNRMHPCSTVERTRRRKMAHVNGAGWRKRSRAHAYHPTCVDVLAEACFVAAKRQRGLENANRFRIRRWHLMSRSSVVAHPIPSATRR
mmetsp:Transcript_7872/g.48714  ORF Transcript_7872/g.48714 Transcript_7872/m.48714 type:complete len:124 (+) Transcript_7872:1455-1826(+)